MNKKTNRADLVAALNLADEVADRAARDFAALSPETRALPAFRAAVNRAILDADPIGARDALTAYDAGSVGS